MWLEGRQRYGGLDLSSTSDITAFVLVFPPIDPNEPYWVLPTMWLPEDTLDLHVTKDHVPYDLCHRQGFIETAKGNVVHYGHIKHTIEQLVLRFNIRKIVYDR